MKRVWLLLLLCALLIGMSVRAEETDIDGILNGMTLEEKVGQMFLARCPASYAHTTAAEYGLGGYVMFADAFENRTPESTAQRIQAIQAENKIPLLIAVDEEGGTVTRVSRYPAFREEKFASPQALYEEGGLERIVEDAREKSELLLSIGVNVNLAPVADVSTNSADFIYKRALGQDAQTTAQYVSAVVEQMKACGMGGTLKHFPGYGSNRDTHTGVAVDKRAYESFEQSDFLPFAAGIEAGVGSVMVSHNIVTCMDKKYPASLSAEVHRVLREELGFEGVIITDDLNMDAISKEYGKEKAAVLAVKAGNDMICTGAYKTQTAAVIKAVKQGRISEARIDESVLRILRWKAELGLI